MATTKSRPFTFAAWAAATLEGCSRRASEIKAAVLLISPVPVTPAASKGKALALA